MGIKTGKRLKSCIAILLVNLILFSGLLLSGCIRNMTKRTNGSGSETEKQLVTPINKEVRNYPLSIEGSSPEWLQGTFVRNGPVSMEIEGQRICHWFDGLAMIHNFTFQNGKLSYSNKFLRTDPYHTVMDKRNFNFLGFASLPKNPLLKQILTMINPGPCPPLQNANVNVFKIAYHYSALTETPLPVEFDLKTAETIGAVEFQDNLPKSGVFDSAHPVWDKRTGEKYNYMVDFGLRTNYIIYRYHPDKPCREVVAKIPAYRPSYMHSFAMTEHYFILVEYPLIVNPIDLLLMNKPFICNYYWKPERSTQFIIIDRRSGCIVRKIKDCEPFFAFHHVNAYEENDNILLDIVTYPNPDIISSISEHGYVSNRIGDNSEVLNNTRLMRYRISLTEGSSEKSLSSKQMFAGPFELPRINEKHSGYPYRYVYGADLRTLHKASDLRPLFKIDTKTNQKLIWQASGLLPGEPIFIPRPGARDEDEGVIVSVVLEEKENRPNKAFLIILDAKNMTELGRAYAPFAIPVGLHGQFFQ